eukprot:766293-Hanusia_phi.AAC.3
MGRKEETSEDMMDAAAVKRRRSSCSDSGEVEVTILTQGSREKPSLADGSCQAVGQDVLSSKGDAIPDHPPYIMIASHSSQLESSPLLAASCSPSGRERPISSR